MSTVYFHGIRKRFWFTEESVPKKLSEIPQDVREIDFEFQERYFSCLSAKENTSYPDGCEGRIASALLCSKPRRFLKSGLFVCPFSDDDLRKLELTAVEEKTAVSNCFNVSHYNIGEIVEDKQDPLLKEAILKMQGKTLFYCAEDFWALMSRYLSLFKTFFLEHQSQKEDMKGFFILYQKTYIYHELFS